MPLVVRAGCLLVIARVALNVAVTGRGAGHARHEQRDRRGEQKREKAKMAVHEILLKR
jgi:hypothetical protein